MTEVLILVAVALLLFGGGKIADMGKGLGEGIRNFKKGLSGDDDDRTAPPAPEEDSRRTSPRGD